jgi:hypothetical protein
MVTLLIAEEEDHKQLPPSKQGNSNRARKQKNRRKANPDELDTGSKGCTEAIGSSVASSSLVGLLRKKCVPGCWPRDARLESVGRSQ